MKRFYSLLSLIGLTLLPVTCFAADSYRWLHVTIDTPWLIFIFLLPMVLIPAILMAVLYWKFAGSSKQTEKKAEVNDQPSESASVEPESRPDNLNGSTDR